MKCPNCGRDLLEGEICTCTTVEQDAQTTAQAQPENEVQPETKAPVEAQEIEQQNEQPQPENTYYQPSEPAPQQGEYQNIYQEQNFNQPMYGAPQQNYYDPNQQAPYYNPVMAKPEPSTDYPENYKPKKKYVAVILVQHSVRLASTIFISETTAKQPHSFSLHSSAHFSLDSVWLRQKFGHLLKPCKSSPTKSMQMQTTSKL